MREPRRIVRAKGEIRLRLSSDERSLLRMILAELESLLEDEPDSPDLHRLFPPAYEDADAEAEYRRLVGGELSQGRRRALETLSETLDRERLTEDEAAAWLTALNDARLVLGTRLDMTETFFDELDPGDPREQEIAVYAYLTWMQEQLVAAISSGL